jgi:UDP-glucose 4-epimerase
MQNMPQRGISAGPGGWSVYEDDNWAGEGMRMSKKVPVLVTGGAGYIGSHAVLALKDAGWDVAVIDNLVTGFAFAVPEGVPLYQGDIADGDLLARIFAERGIQAIMHFAGSVVVPESVENPLKYYHNNTANSRALIEAAVKGGVKHFIFSSTAATYGIPEVSPVTEDSPKQPINPYGMSKLMTEIMLKDVAAAHPSIIARCVTSMWRAPIRRPAPGRARRAPPI